MYILTITYPKSKGATFDFDYFRQQHLPEVGKAFGQFGLGFASVLKGEESLDGKDPAYFAITILSFREEQGAREAVASDGGKALAEDIANFTSVKPVMQFNTAVP
ncbi:MAG: EthD family reductase [Sphingomicrobium sp.]